MTNHDGDSIPHLASRFTQAALIHQIQKTTPAPTPNTVTLWTPSDRHGRIPCIGLDSGHIPGTRPDTLRL